MKKILQPSLAAVAIASLVFSGAGCTKKAKETRAYGRADKFFAEGDYDRAEVEYINVLRVDRFAPRAYAQLGIMALEQGRFPRAASLLNNAIALDTNNVVLRDKFGMYLLTSGRPKDARAQALYVLGRQPDDPEAPLLLADSAVTLNDDDAVRQTLQKLNVPAAKSAPIQVALGSLYLREHELKLAEATLEKARAIDPKFGPLYLSLGNLYELQKDTKRADEAFKTAAESAPIRSPRRIKYAQFKLQSGDIEGGKRILEEVAKKAPDDLSVLLMLGEIAANEKKYTEADQWVTKVLLRDSANFEALLFSARLGMVEGDAAKAVGQYEKLAKAYPKSPQVHYQLGVAYNAAGDTTKAMASFNQALAISPNFADAQVALAEIKMNRGDLSSAIVTLKQVAERYPQAPQPRMLLADAYARQGDLENAAATYRQVEELTPKDPQVPTLRGVALLKLRRRDEARKEFEHALQLSPSFMNAMERLIDMDVSENQFAKAVARVQSAMQLNPNAPEPGLLMAKIELAQKNPAQAVAVLQKIIATHPDYKGAYVMLGNLYSESGQSQKALETGRLMLAKFPDDPSGLMLVAIVLDSQKDVKGAEEAYEKVLKVSPKNGVALNNLAYLYGEHGEVDKGLELARRARELSPLDPGTGDTLGLLLYRKGDYPQAMVVLQDSAEHAPGQAETRYHLGMTRYMLGEENDARVALQFAVQSTQSFNGKDEAALALSILAIDPKTAGPEALATLEKRVAAQPADPVALSRLGAIYKRDGQLDKAIATYEAALKVSPQNLRALIDLGQIYAARPAEAKRAYALAKDAFKLAPDNAELERMLGRLAYQGGDYKWSVSLLQDNLNKSSPPDPEVLFDLAKSSYSVGQVAEAEADARAALQAKPGFSRATEAGRLLDMIVLAKNPAQAVAAAPQVEQTLKTEPDYVPALMLSGIIAEQKPDAAAAREAFAKILAKYPDFAPAQRHLAILYGQNSVDDKKGLEIANKAYELYPDDADVIKALGVINYRLGDYSHAARFLRDSAAKKSGDAQVAFYLGMAQYQLKDRVNSKKTLTRAVELKLPEPLASEAKKVLTELK